MREQRQISSPQSEETGVKTGKGRKKFKNGKQSLPRQIFGLIVAAAAGITTAIIWIFKSSVKDLTLWNVLTVLGGCAAIITAVFLFIKKEEGWKFYLAKIFLTYFIFLGLFFLVFATGKICNKEEEISIVESNAVETEGSVVLKSGKPEGFVRMKFEFAEDVGFKNLSYYTDGKRIEADERADKIHNFVMEQLEVSGFPENYEDDDEKLEGSQTFAEYTSKASEYFEAYKSIIKFDVKVTIKIELLEYSRDQRKEADHEFVTVANCWNIIQVNKSLRDELTIRINRETDIKIRTSLELERIACNRDILSASWNILRIEYTLNKKLDSRTLDEMCEAYLWEKNNDPDPKIDYDAILKAFSASKEQQSDAENAVSVA